uniref:Hyaluronidase n=1 Tax=Loxosceles intermedia TaxID=58218 RepID=HYAL_LOXIN|nr:RecName: Full=Hyaluronidase; AltName: Full=Chondroitinase; AltName: Full=Dietrich's hyaluronidase; AltName: Full=Hyaluronoglucosaminidase; AltName: Full=Spreading factor; Flags: Precursor [Loxosceles intermedia]AGH25912.1 hyaluronidase [Loxosceles intermedia]
MQTILVLTTFLSAWFLAVGFDVFWNVPSQQCKKYGMKFVPLLEQYSILVNKEDNFKGDKITIFYESQLGLYPHIGANDESFNGGIPQLGDLKAHLEKSAVDIRRDILDKSATGLRIIDWEAWRPIWEFNWSSLRKYQDKMKKVVRQFNPTAHESTVAKLAHNEWENSSKSWMLSTLQLGKQLRPNSVWCYYLFPDCYNYDGNSVQEFQCSEAIRKGNDRLKWLWEESTAVCPSIYIKEGQLTNYTLQKRIWFTNGRLQEALRVAQPKARIYPYINYSIKPGMMVPEVEFWRLIAQIASLGMDGAVIWGSSASVGSKNHCAQLMKYIADVLGPATLRIKENVARCSKQACSGRGRCTWPKDTSVIAWKFLVEKEDYDFYLGDIECKCVEGYEGRYCEQKTK